jgi:hypothetical protein
MEKQRHAGGRPEKPDDQKLVQRSIRLLPKHWAKIDAAGLDELRALLERWRPKPPVNR